MSWLSAFTHSSSTKPDPRAHCERCEHPLTLWTLSNRVFVWCSGCADIKAEDYRVVPE